MMDDFRDTAEHPAIEAGHTPTSSGAPRLVTLIGIVGPIFYIAFTTVLGFLWEGYDPIRDTQSELGAVDSPYGDLMNVAGFVGLGATISAFAVAYYLGLRHGVVHVFATLLLLVAGAGMVIVGFFPCDAGCVDATRTGRLHGAFSAPGAIGLPLAAMLSASAFRSDGRLGISWQAASFWLGLLVLTSGPIVAADLVAGANGLLQRAGMWPSLLWMTAVSTKLYWLANQHLRGEAPSHSSAESSNHERHPRSTRSPRS